MATTAAPTAKPKADAPAHRRLIDYTVDNGLAIIALNSASGFAGHLYHARLDPKLTAGFVALALGGMAAGLTLAGRLSGERIRQIFAWLVLFMAVVIVALNLHDVSWG